MTLDDAMDAVYGVAPGEFVEVRNRLSAEAVRDGDETLAKQIKALKKPTAPAALLNLLARRRGASVKDYADLGAKLRDAQSGGAGGDLRELMRKRQALATELLASVSDLATEIGVGAGPGVMRELQGVLLLAAADEGVAAALINGRLAAPPTVGAVEMQAPAAPTKPSAPARSRAPRSAPAAEPAPRRPTAAESKRRRESERRVEKAEAEVAKRQAQLRRARDEAEHFARRITQLQHELDGLETARHKAEHLVTAAETALDHAKQAVEEATAIANLEP